MTRTTPSLIFGGLVVLVSALGYGSISKGSTARTMKPPRGIDLHLNRLPAWMIDRFPDEANWFLRGCGRENAVSIATESETLEDQVPIAEPANVAILRHEPGKTIDQHLSEWLRQIKTRVEFAGDGAVCYVTRTFTLNLSAVPEDLRDVILREVRLAMNGQRRVNGMTIDGSRAGIHYE